MKMLNYNYAWIQAYKEKFRLQEGNDLLTSHAWIWFWLYFLNIITLMCSLTMQQTSSPLRLFRLRFDDEIIGLQASIIERVKEKQWNQYVCASLIWNY